MTGRDNKRGRGNGNLPGQRLSPIARELTSEREPEGQRFPRSISGSSFDAGDPIKQYPKGRVCEVCGTKLSIYNPSVTCSDHPYTKMVVRNPTPKIARIDTKKIRKTKRNKLSKRKERD